MSYTITITKNEPVTVKAGREWKKTGEEPMYPGDETAKGLKKEVYGYTPEYDKVVEQGSEIYKQTVDELDITALVQVVNTPA